jgi:hypothetical protein
MIVASSAGVRERENKVVGLLLGEPGPTDAGRAGHCLGYGLENKIEGGLGWLGGETWFRPKRLGKIEKTLYFSLSFMNFKPI